MAYFPQHERDEINTLLDEGLRRLGAIEDDICTIVALRDDSNPLAQISVEALDGVDPEAQLDIIKKSRAGLRLVKAKIEIDEFSDSDAEEVCRILDDVNVLGRQLAAASKQYRDHISRRVETN